MPKIIGIDIANISKITGISIDNVSKFKGIVNNLTPGTGGSPPPMGIATTNLISHLDFSSTSCYPGSGTSITDLVDDNPYTSFGPTFIDTYGGEFYFDGVNDYIRSNSTTTTVGTISVGVWFKRDGISSANMSLWNTENLNGDGYRHLLDELSGSFYLRSRINTINIDYTTATSDATWYYYVATFNTTTKDVLIYLNGSNVVSGTANTSLDVANEYLMIGSSSLGGSSGATQRFKGYIGEVHVYDRDITSTEVLQNYNATKARYEI